MSPTWSSDLETGDEAIDKDHREIIERINLFQTAYHQGMGEEQIEPLVQYLESYIDRHFTAEEELMTSHNYPGLREHRELHMEFRQKFSDLMEQLRSEGPGVKLATTAYFLMEQWLWVHIATLDKKMADFVMGRQN